MTARAAPTTRVDLAAPLRTRDLLAAAAGPVDVLVPPEAGERTGAARALLDAVVASERAVHGRATGFGALVGFACRADGRRWHRRSTACGPCTGTTAAARRVARARAAAGRARRRAATHASAWTALLEALADAVEPVGPDRPLQQTCARARTSSSPPTRRTDRDPRPSVTTIMTSPLLTWVERRHPLPPPAPPLVATSPATS